MLPRKKIRNFLEQLTEAAKVYAQSQNDIEELRKEGGVIYITLEDH